MLPGIQLSLMYHQVNQLRISVLLVQKSSEMKEVVVEGKRPFIQKLTDRIVVNVDNSIISAGSSAMDVLERSPGVNIDQNDVISLQGKQGVIIMIDGKPTPMIRNRSCQLSEGASVCCNRSY